MGGVEAEKVAEGFFKEIHLVADARLSFYVEQRQVFGYLRGVDIERTRDLGGDASATVPGE